jgi:ketosteroid isomerase-like protein
MSKQMSGLADLEADTVRDFARYWEAVFNDGDYRAIAGYYTLGGRLIADRAETVGGHPAIEHFWQDATERAKAAGVRRTVQADEAGSDGELGYLRGTVVLARAEQVTTVRYLTLWKREADGRWRIAVDISSPSPQPA